MQSRNTAALARIFATQFAILAATERQVFWLWRLHRFPVFPSVDSDVQFLAELLLYKYKALETRSAITAADPRGNYTRFPIMNLL